MSTSRKIGLGMSGLGLLLLLGSCHSMNHAYSLRSEGVEHVGRVIERDQDAGTYTVRWKYLKETYEETFSADPQTLRAHPRNAKVELVLLKDDPGGAVPKGDSSMGAQWTILMLLGSLPCLIIGVGLTVREPGPGPAGPPLRAGKAALAEEEEDDDHEGSGDTPAFVGGRPI